MIPSVLCEQLQNGLREYINTTFPISNEVFKDSINDLIYKKNKIFREPFLSIKLPFKISNKKDDWFEGIDLGFYPYLHQEKSFERLNYINPKSTLVATGTGSGKTECFLLPILEYCYQHRGEPGIKAIIIYPMNALASDQALRISKLIYNNPKIKNDVTAGMYIGDKEENPSKGMSSDKLITDRDTLKNTPPDILLTNYKMLDFLLTRPDDFKLWTQNKEDTLKFIAVDEFHTFDGAQGTDLACLLRRLKERLGIEKEHLCCIGTSATMGSDENRSDMIEFAAKVFGEKFENESIVTEDRESATDFLMEKDIEYIKIPSKKEIKIIENSIKNSVEKEFLESSFKFWFDEEVSDIYDTNWRVDLSKKLFSHFFFQSLVGISNGEVLDYDEFIEKVIIANKMIEHYNLMEQKVLIESMFALISFARKRNEDTGRVNPFLNVHVQLWFRELRRVLAETSDSNPDIQLDADITENKRKDFLPMINCRDCGATGWASILNDVNSAELRNLREFYSQFFSGNRNLVYMFPYKEFGDNIPMNNRGYFCPSCHKLNLENKGYCNSCGSENLINVFFDKPNETYKNKNNNTTCPVCESSSGMTLVGAQNSTLISAGISEIFASKFNDDKKLLTFSDSVQDASHKAGFFNARTWKFNLRVAIQKYVKNGGENKNLYDFVEGLIDYWRNKLDDESFIATFIAPNMTWMYVFEQLIEQDKLVGNNNQIDRLINDICRRIKLETVYEYGFRCRIGRTLEKSNASIIKIDNNILSKQLEILGEIVKNEIGNFRNIEQERLNNFIYGFINQLKNKGGIYYQELKSFVENDGNEYLLSSDRIKWMPGLMRSRAVPKFLELSKKNDKSSFDNISDNSWYFKWAKKNLVDGIISPDTIYLLYEIIIRELIKINILTEITTKKGRKVYGLAPDSITIKKEVKQIICDKCGHSLSISKDEFDVWENMFCMHIECLGNYKEKIDIENFYGRLYSNGDVCRIYAAEHTGLLDSEKREKVEKIFKKDKNKQKAWDINLLSCTPTLEMGIDIGDLSSIILCSVPPSQAQFLQRIGRPGRRDGNALSAVATNLRPHDMYFYEDPKEMISGEVKPPSIFLDASAVLERQFIAFCLDCWIKSEAGANKVPMNIKSVLNNIEKAEKKVFPYNLLKYIELNLTKLFNDFKSMFNDDIEDDSIEKLKNFIFGKENQQGSINFKIIHSFKEIRKERDSIKEQMKKLQVLMKKIEKEPKDSSKDEKIKKLKKELDALKEVVKVIDDKNVYNFLSDEGLLPNYAFPEAGITLKAIIYRNISKESQYDVEDEKAKKYHQYVYEYSRPAVSAIHEFAPENSFYSDGRKMVIDQIDVNVSKPEAWRLCPECSHAQLNSTIKDTASCPKCGSAGWKDSGQIKNMIRLKQVYATDEYVRSKSTDEKDERDSKFFIKELYVDIESENDIIDAYKIDDKEYAFGFEFVKKATLREINFGEIKGVGNRILIAGKDEIRSGFKLCKYCGKIQTENMKGKDKHYYSCSRKDKDDAETIEESIYIFREFKSEILRILIPATTMEFNQVVLQSFIATIMLGLKKYFGSVEHLKATITEEPVKDSEYRKNYLVIYDSVPGGTGYLKHLIKSEKPIFEMLEKALEVLTNCTCANDPNKDGCYKCLFAYKRSSNIGNISRKVAMDIIKNILNNRDKLIKIKSINEIILNSLFDSELEKKFIEALNRYSNPSEKIKIRKDILGNKVGYYLKVNENEYFIELQVDLNKNDKVLLNTRADFVISPIKSKIKPIVIYTDGFTYHKDIVAGDIAKRMAVVKSGEYIVWSLTWKDIENVFNNQKDYYFDMFEHEYLPKKDDFIKNKKRIENENFNFNINVKNRDSFNLLIKLLSNNDIVSDFEKYSFLLGITSITKKGTQTEIEYINNNIFSENKILNDIGDKFLYGYISRSEGLIETYTLISEEDLKKYRNRTLCIFNDKLGESNNYEREWNGFLRGYNLYQFQEKTIFLTRKGLEENMYSFLNEEIDEEINILEKVSEDWKDIFEDLISEDAIEYVSKLKELECLKPDFIGYELQDKNNKIIGEAEIVWINLKLTVLREDQKEFEKVFIDNGWNVFYIGDNKQEEIKKKLEL